MKDLVKRIKAAIAAFKKDPDAPKPSYAEVWVVKDCTGTTLCFTHRPFPTHHGFWSDEKDNSNWLRLNPAPFPELDTASEPLQAIIQLKTD